MTNRLSFVVKCYRSHLADPAQTACARSVMAPYDAKIGPAHAAFSETSSMVSTASNAKLTISRKPGAAVARAVCALSP